MRALRLGAIVCAAMVFGLTLSHVLESPGSRGLPAADWLQVQHTFYGGYAVVGGASEIAGAVCAAVLAVVLWRRRGAAARRRRVPTARRAWTGPAAAAAALGATLVVYWVANRPVNADIAAWTPATLPPDWSASRALWEDAHAVSAVLSLIAFLALVIPLVRRADAPAQAAGEVSRSSE